MDSEAEGVEVLALPPLLAEHVVHEFRVTVYFWSLECAYTSSEVDRCGGRGQQVFLAAVGHRGGVVSAAQ